MNISQLHQAFKIELDKETISSYPSFTAVEIDYWLNKAYLMTINQRFSGNNVLKQGFEASIKRVADLNKLVKTVDSIAVTKVLNENYVYGIVPTDCMFLLGGELSYKDRYSSATKSILNLVSHESIGKFTKTRTNNPVIKEPAMIIEGSKFYVYYDEAETISNIDVSVSFVVIPTLISHTNGSSTIKIAEYMHNDIATLAAYLAVENIESTRVQTLGQTLTIQE